MAKSNKVLINQQYPFLKIYVPDSEDYRQFEAGSLKLDADDPGYEHVLKIAASDPYISILDADDEGATVQIKAAAVAANVCDVCVPAQPFASPEELAGHISTLHADAPKLDAEGNDKGGAATPRVQQGVVGTRGAIKKK